MEEIWTKQTVKVGDEKCDVETTIVGNIKFRLQKYGDIYVLKYARHPLRAGFVVYHPTLPLLWDKDKDEVKRKFYGAVIRRES